MEPINLDCCSVNEIAKIVYNDFAVLQSCTIKGYVMSGKNGEETAMYKGIAVVEDLKVMDRIDHIRAYGTKRVRRQMKFVADSIGGPVSQKIFRFSTRINDKIPCVSIWRIQ